MTVDMYFALTKAELPDAFTLAIEEFNAGPVSIAKQAVKSTGLWEAQHLAEKLITHV